MTDAHDRAKRVISASLIEDVSELESLWLEDHLENCGACREYSAATRNAIQSFRSLSIPISPGLVERTQRRARARAQQDEQAREDAVGVWVAAGLAAALTAITTPAIGQILDWIGQRTDIPASLLQFGYVWFWLIPSLSATLLLVFGDEFSDAFRMSSIKRGE